MHDNGQWGGAFIIRKSGKTYENTAKSFKSLHQIMFLRPDWNLCWDDSGPRTLCLTPLVKVVPKNCIHGEKPIYKAPCANKSCQKIAQLISAECSPSAPLGHYSRPGRMNSCELINVKKEINNKK